LAVALLKKISLPCCTSGIRASIDTERRRNA